MALSFHYLLSCKVPSHRADFHRRLIGDWVFLIFLDEKWPLAAKAFPVYTLRIGLTPRSLRRNVRHSNSAKYRIKKYLAYLLNVMFE